MKLSIIATIYDKYDYLYCVLKSLSKQTYKDFELIIAEDCEKKEMLEYLEQWRKEFSFTIKHVSQEDIGFRKNMILNKALKICTGEGIIIIDGDCLLHSKFIENYNKYFEKGYDVIFGRRCELNEKLTKKILKLKGNFKIKLWNLIFPYNKAWTEAIYFPFLKTLKKRKLRLLGSNMGFTKEIIFRINGFNEDYIGAGVGEDSDLQWRFMKIKAKYKASKNVLIQYHLDHGRGNRGYSQNGWEILNRTRKNNEWYAKNGIIKTEGVKNVKI